MAEASKLSDAVWIILLDHSGSMGRPFSGSLAPGGRYRQTEANIKLVGAKEDLLDYLADLTPSRLALIEFTSTASVVHEGPSNDRLAIESKLDKLEAEDGTDIAVALRKAKEYATAISDVNQVFVMVVSDGLSEPIAAQSAAAELAKFVSRIDVTLIDPTPEGEGVANAIKDEGRGRLDRVHSRKQFRESLAQHAERQRAEMARLDGLGDSYETTQPPLAYDQRLCFTAGYPGAVSQDVWYSLLLYLHLPGVRDEVLSKLMENTRVGLVPSVSSVVDGFGIRKGTTLKVRPCVDGVVFNPVLQEVTWYEDIQEISFRMMVPRDLQRPSLQGTMEVMAQGVLVAEIPLSIQVRNQPGYIDGGPQKTSSTGSFGRVFISYSHSDSPVVDLCREAYRALDIGVYIDKEFEGSGDDWRASLRRFIRKADVFQLYWSGASSCSENVEYEWRFALIMQGQKGEKFIRPLYWEDKWPTPPRELAHIHFARLNLAQIHAAVLSLKPTPG